jgi:hypothetical protein
MPYKSDAQRRYFHYAQKAGKIKKSVVDEYDEESKGKDLPEYKRLKKYFKNKK